MNEVKLSLANLSMQDINVIMAGLGKLPLEAGMDLYMRLRAQFEQQLKAAEQKVAAPE